MWGARGGGGVGAPLGVQEEGERGGAGAERPTGGSGRAERVGGWEQKGLTAGGGEGRGGDEGWSGSGRRGWGRDRRGEKAGARRGDTESEPWEQPWSRELQDRTARRSGFRARRPQWFQLPPGFWRECFFILRELRA